MKALAFVLLVGMAVALRGQQPCESRAWVSGKCLPFCADGQISGSCAQRDVNATMKSVKTPFACVGNICAPNPFSPLNCGKYQHMETHEHYFVPTGNAGSVRDAGPKAFCAPDLHTVTEREWQELMERLKKLEKK